MPTTDPPPTEKDVDCREKLEKAWATVVTESSNADKWRQILKYRHSPLATAKVRAIIDDINRGVVGGGTRKKKSRKKSKHKKKISKKKISKKKRSKKRTRRR
tara:strand:- start:104 stop:409 length:306 start_codon:yes stop_codon:yes gene_type:complete